MKGAIYVKISKIDIQNLGIAALRHFGARSGNGPINRDYEESAKSGMSLHPSFFSTDNAHLPSRIPRAPFSSLAWWMTVFLVNQIKRIERAITDPRFPKRKPLDFSGWKVLFWGQNWSNQLEERGGKKKRFWQAAECWLGGPEAEIKILLTLWRTRLESRWG